MYVCMRILLQYTSPMCSTREQLKTGGDVDHVLRFSPQTLAPYCSLEQE